MALGLCLAINEFRNSRSYNDYKLNLKTSQGKPLVHYCDTPLEIKELGHISFKYGILKNKELIAHYSVRQGAINSTAEFHCNNATLKLSSDFDSGYIDNQTTDERLCDIKILKAMSTLSTLRPNDDLVAEITANGGVKYFLKSSKQGTYTTNQQNEKIVTYKNKAFKSSELLLSNNTLPANHLEMLAFFSCYIDTPDQDFSG